MSCLGGILHPPTVKFLWSSPYKRSFSTASGPGIPPSHVTFFPVFFFPWVNWSTRSLSWNFLRYDRWCSNRDQLPSMEWAHEMQEKRQEVPGSGGEVKNWCRDHLEFGSYPKKLFVFQIPKMSPLTFFYQHPPRGGVWTLRGCLVAPFTIHLAPLGGSRYGYFFVGFSNLLEALKDFS